MSGSKVNFGPLGEPLLLIGEHQKNKENRDLGHQKPQKFLACRRSSEGPKLWISLFSREPPPAPGRAGRIILIWELS